MSQKLTESFIVTSVPGAYPNVTVKSNPIGVSISGNIAIIGEASGGIKFSSEENLKNNFFTPDQTDQVLQKYVSGPIVDAFRALASPSNDGDIQGSANRIYILKSNSSSKASASIPSYGLLSDKNIGKDGNKYYFQVLQSVEELAPSVSGSSIAALSNPVAEVTEIETVADVAGSLDGTYFIMHDQDGSVAFWIDVDNSGTVEPAHGADRSVEITTIATNDSANDVASKIAAVINADSQFSASSALDVITVEAAEVGDLPDATANTSGFSMTVITQGEESDASALTGVQFAIRKNGGASVLIDVLNGSESAYDTIAELAALIDAALPSDMSCVEGDDLNSLKIQMDVDSSANSRGYGKSFELVETSPGDLAALGLSAGLLKSASEPSVEVQIKRNDIGLEENHIVQAQVALEIGYQGTTATLTISNQNLSTSVTGGSGANLNIDLNEYATLKDLAEYINSQTGYKSSVINNAASMPAKDLDAVSALGICSTASNLKPGRVKRSVYNFKNKLSQSVSLDFSATASAGLPSEMNDVQFLSGGDLGGTLASDIVSAVDALEAIDVNFVVPLFSRDASEDIADDLTASSSTYTISAINALVKSHVLKMSTAKIKKHRTAFLSMWSDFDSVKEEAASLATARASLSFQKVKQVNQEGVTQDFLPWLTACIAAGMQAAGFYKGIVNKFANVSGIIDPSNFDSGSIGDQEEAIDSGLLFLKQQVQGIKWVSDQTTYGFDSNFVYNSIQAMYAADLLALDLSQSLQDTFVGKSLADVDASVVKGYIFSKMSQYRLQKLIAASDDAELGFKDLKIEINGPVLRIGVNVKLATLIYFIPINLEISQIERVA